MTNEKAIEELKSELRVSYRPEKREAIEMAIALLKEQEEKPLRCDKCSYHREDGWCGMHGRWVTEADYCSLGAWKGQ